MRDGRDGTRDDNRDAENRNRRRRRHALGRTLCLFYETQADLLETLVSYCKAGL